MKAVFFEKTMLVFLWQTKVWKLASVFDLSNWMSQSSFEVLSLKDILINEHYLKNTKYGKCLLKATTCKHMIFIIQCQSWLRTCSKDFVSNSCTLSALVALEKKILVFVGKVFLRFNMILHIWLIVFFVSLDITVMINVLQEVIKSLQKRRVKTINLLWFHNDESEKNKSKINRGSPYLLSSKIFLV